MSYPNRFGATVSAVCGTAGDAGDNELIAAENGYKIRVVAFSLTTLSTNGVVCTFQSSTAGDELWKLTLKAPADISTGANLATSLPGFLFSTDEGESLNLNLSAAEDVIYSVAYVKEPV